MANQTSAFDDLIRVVARLRAPGGCPWDREQTPESLKPYLIEEAFEVVEAIEEGDPSHLCEELGDLLLHIVFQAQMAREQGRFDMGDVVRGIRDKMIRRHPHVFTGQTDRDGDQVAADWERSKRDDRRQSDGNASILDGIPRSLPALLAAARMSDRASRSGFDWADLSGVLAKLDEELEELRNAIRADDREGARHELGDVLFTLVNVARFLDIDPEDALRQANARFAIRFRHMEQTLQRQGRKPEDADMEELDRLWADAKAAQRAGPPEDAAQVRPDEA